VPKVIYQTGKRLFTKSGVEVEPTVKQHIPSRLYVHFSYVTFCRGNFELGECVAKQRGLKKELVLLSSGE
jgi:hypothetical protein